MKNFDALFWKLFFWIAMLPTSFCIMDFYALRKYYWGAFAASMLLFFSMWTANHYANKLIKRNQQRLDEALEKDLDKMEKQLNGDPPGDYF